MDNDFYRAVIYTLCQIPRETVGFVFPRVLMFPETKSRENKTNWFPEGPDIKCFVIFLDFHFISNKRIAGANQNSRLGTYNTNIILKTTEWMIYKSTFRILSASFSSTRGFVFVFKLLPSFTKKKTGSVFPAFCHATFHHALITCCNVPWAGYIA